MRIFERIKKFRPGYGNWFGYGQHFGCSKRTRSGLNEPSVVAMVEQAGKKQF